MFGSCCPFAWIILRWAAEDPGCRLQTVTEGMRDHDQVGALANRLTVHRPARRCNASEQFMMEPARIVHRQIWRESGLSLGSRSIPEETAVAFTYNGGTYAGMMN